MNGGLREIRLHPKPLLSVLICHLPERKMKLDRLLQEIYQGVGDYPVEILINDGDGTTGAKRNELLDASVAPYYNFWDDDDQQHPNYFHSVFPYIYEGKVDSIGYIMEFRMKTRNINIYCCNAVTEYKTYSSSIFRPILHINITRKSLAKKFRDTSKGEDVFQAKEMIPILKDRPSAFIEEPLYFYNAHYV